LGTTSVKMESGIAVFTDLVLSEGGSKYQLILFIPGNVEVQPVLTQMFDVAQAVSTLQILRAPSNEICIAGSPFALQPQVILLDAAGKPVELSKGRVTAALAENPAFYQLWDPGKSFLAGTRVIDAREGRVIFTDLSLPKASLGQDLLHTGFTLTFFYGAIGTSTSFFFVKAGEWKGLFIVPSTQPVDAVAGRPFTNQARVLLVDDFKNMLLPADVPAGTLVDVSVEEPLSRYGADEESSIVLQRHACQEVCKGSKPVVCTTCSDRRMEAMKGEVVATDLRLDIAGQGYRLTFTASTFSTTSNEFDVENGDTSYIDIQIQPSVQNRADRDLKPQPRVVLKDAYGNLRNSRRLSVEVQLLTLGGIATGAGSPDVPGEAHESICKVSQEPLGGTHIVSTIDAIAAFTDLSVTPAMSGFRLLFRTKTNKGAFINVTSRFFSVEPGDAVGLCSMSLPGRCSALTPCMDSAVIACVDVHGNVQPKCATCFGSECDVRPYGTLPGGMKFSVPCHGRISISKLTPAHGNLHMGANVQSGIDCSLETCGMAIDQSKGLATFTQLVLNPPSAFYTLKFSTCVVLPGTRMIYEWTYISPPIKTLPPAPLLTRASFSTSLASISLSFNVETSMNRMLGVSLTQSDACDAVIDAQFLQTLGASPVCSWSSSTSYLIVPGPGATAGPTTQVRLSNRSSILYVDSFEGHRLVSMPATTSEGIIVQGITITPILLSLPQLLPTPEPIVVSAQKFSSCDLLSLDASLSRGAAMRPFTRIQWSVDYEKSFLYRGLLQSDRTVFEFIKRRIHFSSLLANDLCTITITIRPSAPVEPNSTISISGIPSYRRGAAGCPARPFDLGRPCVRMDDKCWALDLQGPSAYKFASHQSFDPNEQRLAVWWWLFGKTRFFNTIDRDASEGISLEECVSALREVGDYVSADRTLARFQQMDANIDNEISFSEFSSASALPGAGFQSLDLDHSLSLNSTEVAGALIRAGDYISKDQAYARFDSLDSDENGQVSEAEFCAAPGLAMHARHLQFRPSAFQRMSDGVVLKLHSSHYLQPSEDTVVQFQIQNPPLPFVKRPVGISSLCASCICEDGRCSSMRTQQFVEQRMKMDCSSTDLICRSDAEFKIIDPAVSVSGFIRESTSVVGARNMLTLEFHISNILPSGSGLLIRGLPSGSLLPLGVQAVAPVCIQGPSSAEFECRQCSGDSSGSAVGQIRLGEFYMRVNNGTKLVAGRHIVVFPFYNPIKTFRTACKTSADGASIVDRDCPSKVQLTLHISAQYDNLGSGTGVALQVGELGVLGGGDIASWLHTEVTESNRFAGFESHLLIQLEANVDFPIFTTFTISGFPSRRGVPLLDRSQPAIIALAGVEIDRGSVVDCFDPSLVTLNQEGTELSWQMKPSIGTGSCFVPARRSIWFAIPLVNFNVSASDNVKLRIRAQHAGCANCVPDACKCSSAPQGPVHPWDLPWRQLLGRKLKEPDGTISYRSVLRSDTSIALANAQISESNAVSGELATITVSFCPTAAMLAGSNLTVSGLLPSATASSARLTVSNVQGFVTDGSFDAVHGTLSLSLKQDAQANDVLKFSFQLEHTNTGATPTQEFSLRAVVITPVCLSAESPHCSLLTEADGCSPAGMPCVRVREVVGQLAGGVLGVRERRALIVHRISGVTSVRGALDITTVHLQANFKMLTGYSLTISGLAGRNILNLDVDGLTAVKTRIGLGFRVWGLTTVQTRIRVLPNCARC
jgi:Ca2+-binding EF-hand superfamily protein